MKQHEMLRVVDNKPVADDVYSMKLYSPGLIGRASPGQFFHIRCRGDRFPLLRRPISLSHTLRDEGCIVIVYRVAGQGTRYLSGRRPGDLLDVLGPLGRGFEVQKSCKNAAIVGGGIGLAPLVELSGIYGERAAVFAGFKDQPFLLDEFQKRSCDVRVSSENGRVGHRGFVTDLVTEYLTRRRPDIIFGCGPRPMLKELAGIARENSIPCQVSLEERMACGVGACLGCSCATTDKDGGRKYSRVCKDGPVFWSEEVCWDE